MRHLHPSTSVEDVQVSLSDIGHEVMLVSNILDRTTKRPLPLFRIDLKVAGNNSDILKLDLLLHTRSKLSCPRKKLSPPQCHDCQAYYHTSNFCHRSPRCVKYGESHYTSDCTKSPLEPAKCALCSWPHTVSYKGCSVFKKVSENRRKSPSLKTYCHPAAESHLSFYKQIRLQFQSETKMFICQCYSKFLDFKAIINPLLLLLTTVVNHLLPSSFPIPSP